MQGDRPIALTLVPDVTVQSRLWGTVLLPAHGWDAHVNHVAPRFRRRLPLTIARPDGDGRRDVWRSNFTHQACMSEIQWMPSVNFETI
jgi:hypothetical protein